jgi:hypothetical protein
MDADRFAHFLRTLVTTPSRRAITRGLAALVAGSVITPLLGAETDAAKHRGHNHRRRRDERAEQVHDERRKKKKRKKKLPPASTLGSPCAACANPTPICVNNSCVACTSSSQCPARTLCDRGSCQPCTVCESGCRYQHIQSAWVDPEGPAVVRVCPGTYTGNLKITRDGTLVGAGNGIGPGDTVLDGGNTGRVVEISATGLVALRNFHITGGATTEVDSDEGRGGGIWNNAQLTISDCVITGNKAPWGGGMHNISEAHLTRCIVSDNEGMSDEAAGVAGGISNFGRLTLVNSRVTLNRAGDGAGILTDHGIVTLDDSDVDTNTALGFGGGIYADTSQVHLLNGSRITGNIADPESPGAGIALLESQLEISGGSSITGNTPDDCFDGGTDECP